MKREELVINTLVFLEALKEGTLQQDLLPLLHNIGIGKVEVRREFIKDFDKELKAIREKAEEYHMELYYSVPGYVYGNGEILYSQITEYFKEAEAMNCHKVKLCIGDYDKVTGKDAGKLKELCEEYDVLLTVENDQTPENGRSEKIVKFLKEISAFGSEILTTFDIGNWLWQKEDPLANAKLMKQYVAYIHLKDVKGGEYPQAVLLDQGDIDWRNVLKEFPDVPLALEYPCGADAVEQLKKEIQLVTEN